MSGDPVAVLDIGSNSIKLLVAVRSLAGGVMPLHTRSLDARISAGISRSAPRLSEEGMARGVEAVQSLLADIAAFPVIATTLVATSAVRDALNGAEFRARVLASTGYEVRILSGDEEANLIGRGLTADPALVGLRDFYVFDLGGGSMECLAFRGRSIEQAVSLQLGCVRLTEKFVSDPTAPLSPTARQQIAAHARDVLNRSGFAFCLPAGTIAIGTGGTVTTVRAILGAKEGMAVEATARTVTVAQLRDLLDWLGALPLTARREIPGLPSARADVFPIALATLIAVADLGGLSEFENSLYNLRYGLADQLLPTETG